VRKFLRDKVTKAYAGEGGTWTPHLALAREFESTAHLVEVATAYTRSNLEMVLMMGDTPSQFDVVLPLSQTPPSNVADESLTIPGAGLTG